MMVNAKVKSRRGAELLRVARAEYVRGSVWPMGGALLIALDAAPLGAA
jgi:hypothetical protein